MSWLGCSFIQCGTDNSTPYESQLDSEIEEIIKDCCNEKNLIFIDQFIRALMSKGVPQSDAEELFDSLLGSDCDKEVLSINKRIALANFSHKKENYSKLKNLLSIGKLNISNIQNLRSKLPLEISAIINTADKNGVIYEKQFLSALKAIKNVPKDKAELIWSVLPSSNKYNYVSTNKMIEYFGSAERQEWLSQQILSSQQAEQQPQSPSFPPLKSNMGNPNNFSRPQLNRATTSRPRLHSYSNSFTANSSVNSNADNNNKQFFLKDQLFKALATSNSGNGNVITKASWETFPWNAAGITPEIALNIFTNIPKNNPTNDFITKDEFDNFFMMNYDKLSPMLLKGYRAIQHQKVMLIRKQSLSVANMNPSEVNSPSSNPPSAPGTLTPATPPSLPTNLPTN